MVEVPININTSGKRPRYVSPIGPRDAKILLLGEAPGKDEDELGVPFVGGSGQLLTQFLVRAGINRNECYITNCVKYKPPGNKIDRLVEVGVNRLEEEQRTREEIEKINPNIIVPLGGVALQCIMGLTSITKYRGSVMEYKGMKVIPTLHPAYIMRVYRDSVLFLNDLVKIRRHSSDRTIQRPQNCYTLRPSFEEALTLLDEYSRLREVGFDIETDFGANYIKCVGFAKSREEGFTIPIVENFSTTWNKEEEVAIWKGIKSITGNEKILKVIQNQHFECSVLRPWVGEIVNIFDTMLAHHLILPETRKNLGNIISLYTDNVYHKDDAKNSMWEGDSLLKYNIEDCCRTLEVYIELKKELETNGLTSFHDDFQVPFNRIMEWASHIGIKVDLAAIAEHKEKILGELLEEQQELDKILGKPTNVDSPKQMAVLLYETLQLPKQIHRQTKKVSTDEDAINYLARKFPMRLFDIILGIRTKGKLLSTYLGVVKSKGGGRIDQPFWDNDSVVRVSWNVTGTDTGRLSATDNVRGTGIAIQTIPELLRNIFIARSGCVFVKVDLQQADSRMVAYLSEDPYMMNVFEEGRDIHVMVASMVFDKPESHILKKSIERRKAKTLGHAANYVVGPNKFALEAGCSVAEAKLLLRRYYTLFKLEAWHDTVIKQLFKDRTLITPLGRKRTFFDRWGDQLFRAAIAHVPQSTVGDHVDMAAVEIHPLLPPQATILIENHDELVIECLEKDTETVKTLIRNAFERSILIKGRDVVIPIDMAVGKNWRDVKETT